MTETSTTENRRRFFRSLEADSLRKRSKLTKFADKLTNLSGSPVFLVANAAFFAIWITLNVGIIPGFVPFDPFPFGLLTMAVSLEAIFLSIFVLVSQNRSAYISTVRDEVELYINVTAEQEITKILQILADIRKEMGIKKRDEELELMLHEIDQGEVKQNIAAQIQRAGKSFRKEFREDIIDVIGGVIKKPVKALLPEANQEKSTNHKK